jgi:Tfp pilus assembly protein PilF
LGLGDYQHALPDLEEVVRRDPKHDFLRAQGLLAHAYALNGNVEAAGDWFRQATETSTISETLYNYAAFLKLQGRNDEARQWAQRVLDKKATLPGYLKRRERPWFRKAAALKNSLPKSS